MEKTWRLHGRVQGVSLRAWCAKHARRLGLGGWVRNEPDGTVLLRVRGKAEAIGRMEEGLLSLHQPLGPDIERIEEVEGLGPDEQAARGADAEFVILQ